MQVKALLLFGLFMSLEFSAFAQDELVEKTTSNVLKCIEKGTEANLLLEVEGNPVQFIDVSFSVLGPYVSPIVACNRWLSELTDDLDLTDDVASLTYRNVYSGNRSREAHFFGNTRDKFYKSCQKSAFCKVNFPYSLFEPRYFFLSKDQKLPDQCFTPPKKSSNEKNVDIAKVDATKWDQLENLKIGFNPQTSFIQDILDSNLLNQPVSFVSTMSLSSTALKRVKSVIKEKPGHKVFVIFNMGVDIQSSQLTEALELADDQVFLVPQFRHPEATSSFHIKAASSLSSPQVLWTSSNLRSEKPTQYVDLNFSFQNLDISRSLNNLFLQEISSTCTKLEYLECPISADHSSLLVTGFRIRSVIQRTCAEFYADKSIQNLLTSTWPEPKYIRSGTESIEALVSKKIESAKSSVLLVSHRFSNQDIALHLDAAAKRGVNTALFARNITHWPDKGVRVYMPDELPYAPFGHSKALVIDNRWALVSSGNFTENGLSSAGEISFVTEDPRIITAIERYARMLSLHGSGGSSFFMSKLTGDEERYPSWLLPPVVWDVDFDPTATESPPAQAMLRGLTPSEMACTQRVPPSLFYTNESFRDLCPL